LTQLFHAGREKGLVDMPGDLVTLIHVVRGDLQLRSDVPHAIAINLKSHVGFGAIQHGQSGKVPVEAGEAKCKALKVAPAKERTSDLNPRARRRSNRVHVQPIVVDMAVIVHLGPNDPNG